jgi:hypothetical protein
VSPWRARSRGGQREAGRDDAEPDVVADGTIGACDVVSKFVFAGSVRLAVVVVMPAPLIV